MLQLPFKVVRTIIPARTLQELLSLQYVAEND